MVDLTLIAQHTPLAYLDGGTGSMLLQAGLAGLLTVGYFMKSQWAAVKSIFSRK